MKSIPKLILCPKMPHYAVGEAHLSLEHVLRTLQQIGLVADPFQYHGEEHYQAGEAFLELITFLGCSPSIELIPQPDHERYTHISLSYAEDLRFRDEDAASEPRCPSCRAPITQWRSLIQQWRKEGESTFDCPHCEAPLLRLDELNWRHSAGFGHLFIDIWNVFPHEAVPSDRLLEALELMSGTTWNYFYLKSQPG